jgi:glyoxylase-like metal-dependent hydrolase (beta-lactamase superfamily II)/rhodanese-related sulfurtransferase
VIFEQLVSRDLGCACYVVGCEKAAQALVVDPPLDVAPVLAACRLHGAALVGVIETHTHADHVSGHGVLAARHGAWIAIHPAAEAAYAHRPLADGEHIEIGTVALEALHTPGHRPEHCCFAVIDRTRADEPWMLLTGDSLFVGDVARPDLAIAGEEGAAALHRSLHVRLAHLDDAVEVFPGHVAGSLCGRGMSSRTSTTLGFERRFNPMLATMPVVEFVARANDDLAPKPPTMERVVEINRGPLLAEPPAARLVERVPERAALLDVRNARAFSAGHVPRSLGVPIAESGFATRTGFLVDTQEEVVILAADPRQAGEAARSLAAVGFLRLAELAGGAESPSVSLSARYRPITVAELAGNGLQIVDVREPDEQDVLAPGALAIPYRLVAEADLDALDPRAPTATVCQSGIRSAIAASLLERRGFTDVRPVLDGGMGGWPDAATVGS